MTRIGSLCSGYAGLDLAVREVIGGDLTWVADIDPGAVALLAHHYPSIKNIGDITAVDWSAVEPVDLQAGGFPCTDVSAAGRRAGLKHGNRSGLWHEFVKAIAAQRPRMVVIENVLGLLTARGDEPTPEHLAAEATRDTAGRLLEWLGNEVALAVGKGDAERARGCRKRAARATKARKRAIARCQWHEQRLIRAAGTVLADLADLGYDAEWVVVTASAAGACHRRARIFILAFPDSGRALPGDPVAVIEGGAWMEARETLFGMTPFTGRIPASGRMAGGRIYAAAPGPTEAGAGLLPTPRVQTHGGGAAADPPGRVRSPENPDGHSPNLMTAVTLLKTPTAQLAVNGGSQHPDKRRAGGHGPTLADQVEHELLPTPRAADGMTETMETTRARMERGARHRGTLEEAAALLPTPAARDGKGRDMPGRAGGKSLPETLLPTPRATDGTKGGPNQRGSSGDLMLPSAVMALLPTPMAADGDRMSTTFPRGNETLLGALLPTPSVADGTGGHTSRSGGRKGEALLGGIAMLLPTPTAQDAGGSRNATARRNNPKPTTHADGWTLSDVLWTGDLPPGVDTGRLLPTPAAGNFNDGEDLDSWEARRQRNLDKGINGNGQGTPLPVAEQQLAGGTDWGPYEAAIRRWEAVTGRPAPPPTVPGRTGARLNPALPEFMMGLPEGWITGVPGLSRNAMLKLAGNGCVPQQVALALRILLGRSGVSVVREAA